MKHKRVITLTSLLIVVPLSSLRVGSAASSLLSTTFLSFISLAAVLAPVSFEDLSDYSICSVVCTCIMPSFSDPDRLTSIFGSNHSAAENSIDRFLHNDAKAGCKSGQIIIFSSSLSPVTSAYCSRGRTIFRAFVTDYEGVENTSRKPPLCERNFLALAICAEFYTISSLNLRRSGFRIQVRKNSDRFIDF